MRKKKIIIFLQDGVGGAERMSVLFGKSLPVEYFDVRFILVERDSKTSIADFIPKDYSIIRVPNSNPFKMMFQLFCIIRQEKPHVVFSSVMYLNTKILPFRLLFTSTQFVIRCENYLYTFSKKQHGIIRLTYRLADAIIAQTQEMKDELVQEMHIDDEKINVLQNPIDAKLIDQMVAEGENPYPQNGKKHFVASGRFAYQKGFDLLIKSFCLLTKKRNDVDLYIIGDKYYEGKSIYREIINIAQENGLAEFIHCVGYQKNPYVYVKYADCFVLSSRWEGLPNVMIEALYLSTPVAAFKCIPVIERIAEEGKTGFLAEKEDVASLSSAMEQALGLGRVSSSYNPTSLLEFEKIVSVRTLDKT